MDRVVPLRLRRQRRSKTVSTWTDTSNHEVDRVPAADVTLQPSQYLRLWRCRRYTWRRSNSSVAELSNSSLVRLSNSSLAGLSNRSLAGLSNSSLAVLSNTNRTYCTITPNVSITIYNRNRGAGMLRKGNYWLETGSQLLTWERVTAIDLRPGHSYWLEFGSQLLTWDGSQLLTWDRFTAIDVRPGHSYWLETGSQLFTWDRVTAKAESGRRNLCFRYNLLSIVSAPFQRLLSISVMEATFVVRMQQ